MNIGKHESGRREFLSVRLRQTQLGRGLRLMYERVLREPVPADMVEALHAAMGGHPAAALPGDGSAAAR